MECMSYLPTEKSNREVHTCFRDPCSWDTCELERGLCNFRQQTVPNKTFYPQRCLARNFIDKNQYRLMYFPLALFLNFCHGIYTKIGASCRWWDMLSLVLTIRKYELNTSSFQIFFGKCSFQILQMPRSHECTVEDHIWAKFSTDQEKRS